MNELQIRVVIDVRFIILYMIQLATRVGRLARRTVQRTPVRLELTTINHVNRYPRELSHMYNEIYNIYHATDLHSLYIEEKATHNYYRLKKADDSDPEFSFRYDRNHN